MILKNLSLYLQNIHKNKVFINTILEAKKDFDIIFIQKPPWNIICSIPSSTSKKRDKVIDTSNYPD